MLKNKVVLITGVSKGIGLSCLKLCLENNAYVKYQDTKLSSGKIKVDWQTNLLDAINFSRSCFFDASCSERAFNNNISVFCPRFITLFDCHFIQCFRV